MSTKTTRVLWFAAKNAVVFGGLYGVHHSAVGLVAAASSTAQDVVKHNIHSKIQSEYGSEQSSEWRKSSNVGFELSELIQKYVDDNARCYKLCKPENTAKIASVVAFGVLIGAIIVA